MNVAYLLSLPDDDSASRVDLENIDRVGSETLDSLTQKRVKLPALIEGLDARDTLTVARLEHLAGYTAGLVYTLCKLAKRGVTVVVTEPPLVIPSDDPLMSALVGAIKTIMLAMYRKQHPSKRPTSVLDDPKVWAQVLEWRRGGYTIGEIAEHLGIKTATLNSRLRTSGNRKRQMQTRPPLAELSV